MTPVGAYAGWAGSLPAVDLLVDDVLEVPVAAWKEMFESLLYASTGHRPRWEDPERFARELATLAGQAFT